MGEKLNTPESYDRENTGTYEPYYEMVGHVGGAWDTHGLWVEYEAMVEELHGAALLIDTLESSHAELLEALGRLKKLAHREHTYCEDGWYSCPKAEDGCYDDHAGDDCNCGADEHNAEVARATEEKQ